MTVTTATRQADYELLLQWSALIAMLPIDQWLEDLEHAESIAPVLDPTLYRDYIYSAKPEVLKKVMHAALSLKRTVEEAQQDILAGKVER